MVVCRREILAPLVTHDSPILVVTVRIAYQRVEEQVSQEVLLPRGRLRRTTRGKTRLPRERVHGRFDSVLRHPPLLVFRVVDNSAKEQLVSVMKLSALGDKIWR